MSRHYFYTKNKKGLELICNECGAVEFLKRLEGHEFIGGKVKPEKYEEPSKGWIESGNNHFCPVCARKN